MWLNNERSTSTAISAYRKSLLQPRPNHIVIDNLFNESKLDEVVSVLQQPHHWKTQQHTYSALYADDALWQKTSNDERFVQRDIWQRALTPSTATTNNQAQNVANDFLSFLRGDIFMSFVSKIFKTELTDINVENPLINTNYFRLSSTDFVRQHADDSPGREVCMLLYMNKKWEEHAGGELVFMGNGKPIHIAPHYNRCVLFDPFSKGSEHWVAPLTAGYAAKYRYNVTSWYWSE